MPQVASPTPGESAVDYVEHLRRADLSVGTYSLRAGAADRQSPHAEDEVYVVASGAGRFTADAQTVDVGPGSALFAPAGEAHWFHDITEDLAVLVFFAPAYGSRATHASRPEENAHSSGHIKDIFTKAGNGKF